MDKLYIGTKIVRAVLMGRNDFEVAHKGAEACGPEAMQEGGYMVTYPDGYKSWCPQVTFEASNREISNSEFELISPTGKSAGTACDTKV